jgi:hypothetical protein
MPRLVQLSSQIEAIDLLLLIFIDGEADFVCGALLVDCAKISSPRAGCMRLADQGTHLRRDTVIPQWFQASKAAAASDGHAVHC